MTQTTDCAVLAAGLQSEDTQSLGDNHALLVVIWWGNALEGL